MNSVLFNLAHAYALTSDQAWSAISTSGNADFSAPAIMCQSFAVELLLKFFIVAEHPSAPTEVDFDRLSVNLRGHSYCDLFDRLSPSSQDKIARGFGAKAGQGKVGAFRDALISLGDNPFVFWRYPYEASGISTLDKTLLDQVTDTLGRAAEAERRRLERQR